MLADAAVRLAEEFGVPVFPLRGDKTPCTAHGFKDAVLGEDAIYALFEQHPNAALIGLATGGNARLVVIDIDRKNGKDGFQWGGLKSLPPTLAFETPSGGQHRYYRLPPGSPLRCSASVVFDGIDLRADGGYVAQGESYRRIVDLPVADLSEAEIALLSRPRPISGQIADLHSIASSDAARRVRDIAPGQWHENVRDTVAHLISKGVADDVIQSLMARFTTAGFSEADTRREVQTMIDGARRKGWAPEPPETRYLPIQSASEIFSAEPPEWLIDGLLPRVGVGLLNGPSGSGKTYVAVDAAMAVANGSAFANNHPTEKGRVLYAAGEDRAGVARRIVAHSQHSGLSDAGIGVWQGVSLAGLYDIEHLISLGVRYDFVINDTLSRATPGLDENSNSDMAAAIDRGYRLSAAWRCFVLIVCHTGKDVAKGVRGASALVANVDTVLKVTRPGRGSIVSVTIEKQKSGREDIAVDLKLEEVEVTSPATGEVISDLVVLPTGPSAPILCRRVLHAEPGLTAKGVFDRVTRQRIDPCNPGVTLSAVKAALSRMVASGEAANDGGEYSLLARGGEE